MNIKPNDERVKELSKILLKHQYLYYVKAEPEISDREYDALFDELTKLETDYPELQYPDSPTKRVGSDLDNTLPEVEHTIPVLSLDKCYSTEDLTQWIEKVVRLAEEKVSIVVEQKIDGASIVLYYSNGILERAVTRGNGSVGNDITENVKTIPSVPLHLNQNIDIVVRGEIFIGKKSFQKYNAESGGIYSNPRNLAAGILRSVKSSKAAAVPLDVFIYEGYIEGSDFSHVEILDYLDKMGFRINQQIGYFSSENKDAEAAKNLRPSWFFGNMNDIESFIEQKQKQRSSLDYEIDGLVLKVNEIPIREKLGYTAHHPRWAVAYKFEAPQAVTKLLGITPQIGRNGRITPVAELEPVELAGSKISRATLHNQDYINMLNLCIGDTVTISKRGDVIPAVEEVLEENHDGNKVWMLPDECSECGTPLKRDGAHSFCTNFFCPERVVGRLAHFAGKAGLDINGLGEKTVRFLFNKGFIKTPADFYNFNYELLLDEEGFGEKKINLIREGLNKSKNKPFPAVLTALGFEGLGKRTVEVLVENGFNKMRDILSAAKNKDIEAFALIDGIGDVLAELFVKEFSNSHNLDIINRLTDLGLKMEYEKKDNAKDKQIFVGQRWCVTGSFENFKPRDKAKIELKKRGAAVLISISSKTTHLLAGDGAGSKLSKAENLGVTIVDEKEFLKMIK